MTVRIERPAEAVAELVLDRPEALNAISTAQARAITAACAELADDGSLSVVLLTSSSPKAFCVGADLKERNSFDDAALAAQRPVFRSAFGAVLDLPVPTVAAVDGYALGGGFELALCCDLIVASSAAVLGLPETGVGLVPGGGGTQLLVRRVGSNRAADLLFTARHVDAEEAHRLGAVDRLVPAGQARAAALELAGLIASRSPIALRAAKQALRRGSDLDLESALVVENRAWEEAAFSADRREGIAAFNERRAPRWRGTEDAGD
ncbi:enoyl-CoA hydratase/isomerase family protein [Microlunatus ginsengisoli]|uniref:Enoyl-CoA hydratase-related protein n=1 Tax=Microlunatus ginsengisoli TaxID=363863 RepID=A0ABP6ZEG8_9ACTN